MARVFGDILGHRVDYADLYFQYSRSEAWSLDEGIVKSGSFNIDQGSACGRWPARRQPSPTPTKSAPRLWETLGAPSAPSPPPVRMAECRFFRLAQAAWRCTRLWIPASLPADAKVKLLERLEAHARRLDSRVCQVMASLTGEYEVILVAGSDGRLAADLRPLVRCSVSVIVEDGGRREQGSSGGGGRFGYAYFEDAILERYAREAVHQAVTNLDAVPARPVR